MLQAGRSTRHQLGRRRGNRTRRGIRAARARHPRRPRPTSGCRRPGARGPGCASGRGVAPESCL